MKKVLLVFCAFLAMQGRAQLSPPFVTEDEFHPGATWEGHRPIVTHTNAHSYGNLLINGVNSDLYVFTWDYANEPLYPPEAGINVRQYAAGTSVDNTTTPLFEDALLHTAHDFPGSTTRASLEAGILREGGNTYIVLSHYQITWAGGTVIERDVYLDLYEWTGGGGLNLVSSDNLSQQGNLPFDWVHLDVNNLTDVVVTWGDHSRVHTVGGVLTGGGLQLSGIGVLDEGTINGYDLGRPDVAMMRNTGGETALYYVMTPGDVLFVTKGRFDELMSIPPGSIDPLPVEVLDQKGTAGEFIYDIPRIDAPDNALYTGHEAWSYVVTENYPDADYAFTGSYSDQNGSLLHAYLNNGSVVSCGNCDISDNGAMDPDVYNQRAVVAYSDNGSDRFYAWCFRKPGWGGFPAGAEAAYVSVKTDENLSLLHTPPALNAYFRIPNDPDNTSYSQSVGLSTQNDASPELFMAFIQWPDNPPNYEYYFGLKTVDWSTTNGFRPENPTSIAEVNGSGTIQVSPNPFSSGFVLDLEGGDASVQYELKVYNILGQVVYRDKGTVESINRSLGSIGEKWSAGAYYLELGIRGQGTLYRYKVVKW